MILVCTVFRVYYYIDKQHSFSHITFFGVLSRWIASLLICMKNKRNRPDLDGNEQGIYKHNRAIIRKTATICALCGMPLDKSLRYPHPMSISVDHIIPVALGGKSRIDNLQATHLVCNKQKGKKLLVTSKEDYKIPTRDKVIPQYIDWSNYEG